MAKQLVFTSVLRGLEPGRSGYCTVARHRDLRERLIPEIERLSAYHHLNYTTDGRVVNPVVMAFRTLSMGDTRYHVLTRIVDAGADYSRRSNYLAHHLIIEEKEIPEGLSPADVFLGWNGWLDKWEGEPRFYGVAEEVSLAGLAAGLAPALPAQNWEAMTGDAGAAAAPLDAAPRQGFAFAIRPGSERVLLSLYRESAALLPAAERWKTGFTSYLQETDRQNDFRWAGHWPDHQPFTASGWTVLDLRRAGLVPVPAGPVAARARVAGTTSAPVPTRVAASTTQVAGGAAKKWDVSKPGAGGRMPAAAGTLSRPAAPKSRGKWPLIVVLVVVLLGAAGGAGYWFVQSKETEERDARERKRKDSFDGMPVGEKLAGDAPRVDGQPPVMAPTPAPLPTRALPVSPPESEAVAVAPPRMAPVAPPVVKESRTYVAWRKVGEKLSAGIFDSALPANASVAVLKDSGEWIQGAVKKDENGLKIGPAADVDGYLLLIQQGRIDNIPSSLSAVKIGETQIVFVAEGAEGHVAWPGNRWVSLELAKNKAGKFADLAELLSAGSGERPVLEYRFPVNKDLTDAFAALTTVDAVIDGAALRAAIGSNLDAGRRYYAFNSVPGTPEKLADPRGVGAALDGYGAGLKKLNRALDFKNLQQIEGARLGALKKSIGLPVLSEDVTLKKLAAIDLTENNTPWELAERVIEIVLGGDYGTIPFSRDDKSFTIEGVWRYADDFYKRDPKKNASAKVIAEALAKIASPKLPPEEKFSRSLAWITAIRESIVEANKAIKAFEAAQKSTTDSERLTRHFDTLNPFLREALAGNAQGAEVYLVMENGARVKLGKIDKDSAK